MEFFSWVDHFYFTFGSFLVSIFTSCLCDCLDSFHCCLIYLLFPRSVRSFPLITVTVSVHLPPCALCFAWLHLRTLDFCLFLFWTFFVVFLCLFLCLNPILFILFIYTLPNLCICAIFNTSLKVYSVYPKVYLTICLIV